jgi:hypothetical protein
MLNTIAPGTGGAGMNTSFLCYPQLSPIEVHESYWRTGERDSLDLRPLVHLHRLGIGKYKSKSPTISTTRLYLQSLDKRYEL